MGDDEAVEPEKTGETHTDSGAPTDEAHRDVGDGALLGSIPAGVSLEELEEIAKSDKVAQTGTS